MEELKYPEVLFTIEGNMEWETDGLLGVALAGMLMLNWSAMGKREWIWKRSSEFSGQSALKLAAMVLSFGQGSN